MYGLKKKTQVKSWKGMQKIPYTFTKCFNLLGKISTSGGAELSPFMSFNPSEWLISRFTSCAISCGVGKIG
jgi:hypothetical protein